MVTYPEKENSLADSHVAKLLLIAFEKQKVVDTEKWFQSAVDYKSWQCGSKISSSELIESPYYFLAIGENGGNITIGRIPGNPPLLKGPVH